MFVSFVGVARDLALRALLREDVMLTSVEETDDEGAD
jgi:hypothetical protein